MGLSDGGKYSTSRDGGIFRAFHFRKKDDEFVPSHSTNGVRCSATVNKPAGNGLEEPVANEVPQRVIDVLETIQVKYEHRNALRVTPCKCDCLIEAIIQKRSIGQTRQAIMLS